MKNKLVELVFILDRSGSMAGLEKETIGGYNSMIEKQKKESERLLIESEGIKKSQDIINTSITDKLIKFKALDITRELMKSPNAKIIITDGKSPVILGDNK